MLSNNLAYILYGLLIVNAVTFIVYGIDKWKSKRNKWRISEVTLLCLAFLGGCIGAWLGMKIWRHKTQHKKFKYGIPAIFLLQAGIVLYMFIRQL